MVGRFLFSFLMAAFIMSCHAPHKSQINNQNDKPQESLELNKNGEASDKIAFLTFEVTLADSIKDEYSFRLMKTFFAIGTLKKDRSFGNEQKDPTYLYCQVDGENDLSANFIRVPDPLKMLLEYPGENGSLNKKIFYKKRGEITVRFQFEKNLKTISIFKVDSSSFNFTKIYYAIL